MRTALTIIALAGAIARFMETGYFDNTTMALFIAGNVWAATLFMKG